MNKQEYRQEITYYVHDIFRYFDQDDIKSCLISARGLVKLLIDYKKVKNG